MSPSDDTSRLDPLPRLLHGSLPPVEWLPAEEIPPIERGLLAHDRDMTPTLEEYAGETVGLRRISGFEEDDCVYREVLLTRAASDAPLLYGAIRIHLAPLPGAVRELVLGHRVPLGTILANHAVPHESHPAAFFRVKGFSPMLDHWADVDDGTWCHARRNVLTHRDGSVIAEVVEIIPPQH